MKRIRGRLTLAIYILIIGACVLSLLFSYLIRSGVILVRENVKLMFFGVGLRDVLLVLATLLAIAASVTVVSRSTTDPIRTLTRATKQIASGNFDVQVNIRNRAEEFEELQNNFNLMARELQANEYLKKDFVSGVSHELRTPLSVIGGYAKLLREDNMLTEEERREYLDLIISETDRLTDLTSNMLRLSRMDSEQIQPRRETFSLDEQLRQAVLLLEPKWSAKDLEMDVDLPEISWEGDAELLIQVWTNLIGNAVKYTDEGEIRIRAEETGEAVRVTVEDTGCGMEPEVLARAFDRFYQADTSRRREGSGLGLAIVRRIVELHGGTVTAESEPGKGSRFTVILPAGIEDPGPQKQERRRPRRELQKQKKSAEGGTAV